jgi:hypothetical protein
MLTVKRVVTVGAFTIVLAVVGALPAFANGYGNVQCDQDPSPACQLGAGTTGGGGGQDGTGGGSQQPSQGHGDSGHGGGGSGGTSGGNGDTIIGGGGGLANCSYVPSDYQPPSGAISAAYIRPSGTSSGTAQPAGYVVTAARTSRAAVPAATPQPGQSGSWYVWKCTGPGIADALYHPPVWIANGQAPPGAAPTVSPAALAQMARNQLRLPTPVIAANPPGEQLVSLPTWLWLSGGWTTTSATASVPGVSVTAVATPTSVTWSMGDGNTVSCAGPGTSFPTGTDPHASSPTCGYTYRSSSAGQPGEAYAVSATVHWTVTWSGAGQNGVFPDMTTTGTAAFRVAESQAINTGG